MIGAIAGDIVGSVYEHHAIKTKDFVFFHPECRFTDDTVLTVAVAQAILTGGSYEDAIRRLGQQYPHAGYGGNFSGWLHSTHPEPYNSWGNGSAMRVSPVGFAFDTEEEVLVQAKASAEITHNHPDGVKGAQATALAVFLAGMGADKESLRREISKRFDYDLNRSVDSIRPYYSFDVSCMGSVPEAIVAFLDSNSYEDAVRNAVSLGGDADTLACIAGGIAQAFYGGVPEEVTAKVKAVLPPDLWAVVEEFSTVYGKPL